MSIERTSNGKWRVRYDIGRNIEGKRIRKSKVVETKREAQALEHLWAEQVRTNSMVKDTITFAQFVREYYIPAKESKVRYNTLRAYKRDISLRLIPAFGHLHLEKITRQRVQSMLHACASYKVAKNARDTLRQILNEAISQGFLNENVAALAYEFPKRLVYPEDHNGTWLTTFEAHDEFVACIDHERLKTIAVLGLSLGLRKGEIFGLDWEHVDLKRRFVHVRQTYVEERGGYKLMLPKTEKSIRTIPLRKSSAAYLATLERKGVSVLTDEAGRRANPRSSALMLQMYLKDHGLPNVTILNMRHSFATACINAGIDVTKVSRMLGHTQISTTVQRYVRFKEEDLIADIDAVVD